MIRVRSPEWRPMPWMLALALVTALVTGCSGAPERPADTATAAGAPAADGATLDAAPVADDISQIRQQASDAGDSRGGIPSTRGLAADQSPAGQAGEPAGGDRDISSIIKSAPRDPATRLRQEECWFTVPPGSPKVSCYRMQVPESHNQPNSRQIEFPVVRLSIPWGVSSKTPVLHLGGGGPGNPLGLDTESIGNWIWDWYREFSVEDNRDLYLMDPRGVGMARPVLVCSEYIPAFLDSLGRDLSVGEEIAWNQRINRQCLDRLQREGVDLASYNSINIARDVAMLSQALGIERWNLYGVSYGTRYALTLAREYPALVESMVLDAAVFPNVRYMDHYGDNLEQAFRRLLGHCAADLACRQALINPEWRFWKLVRTLNQTPLEAKIRHPTESGQIEIVLNGERFLSVVYNTLYDAEQFRDLPEIVESLESGELGLFEQKINDWVAFQTDADYGDASAAAHFCHEESPFIDYDSAIDEASELRPELREASVALLRYNQDQCRRWPVPPGDRKEGEPVNTNIPTLFLHGALDPVLPVENLQQQMRHFGNADFEIFADVSHSIVGIHPCGETLVTAFYNYKLDFRDHVSCVH